MARTLTDERCTPWCDTKHTRSETERLCLKRIEATRDVDGTPVTIILERLASADGAFEVSMLVEALAPLSLPAVYELAAALVDAGKIVQATVAA